MRLLAYYLREVVKWVQLLCMAENPTQCDHNSITIREFIRHLTVKLLLQALFTIGGIYRSSRQKYLTYNGTRVFAIVL